MIGWRNKSCYPERMPSVVILSVCVKQQFEIRNNNTRHTPRRNTPVVTELAVKYSFVPRNSWRIQISKIVYPLFALEFWRIETCLSDCFVINPVLCITVYILLSILVLNWKCRSLQYVHICYGHCCSFVCHFVLFFSSIIYMCGPKCPCLLCAGSNPLRLTIVLVCWP